MQVTTYHLSFDGCGSLLTSLEHPSCLRGKPNELTQQL